MRRVAVEQRAAAAGDDPSDAGHREQDAEPLEAAQPFAEQRQRQQRAHHRCGAHHQHAQARSDQHVGLKEHRIADRQTDDAGEAEPQPAVGRGVEGQRRAQRQRVCDQQEQDRQQQAGAVEDDRAEAPAGDREERRRAGPAHGGGERGEFTEQRGVHGAGCVGRGRSAAAEACEKPRRRRGLWAVQDLNRKSCACGPQWEGLYQRRLRRQNAVPTEGLKQTQSLLAVGETPADGRREPSRER